ncbi:MAG: PEP-CTERM sorting domain-containing protein [candidate division Zixibacteria bacterium]|nr:PEP-CTERM sorting domain-containing protein [candidate division Zixibacteria bacterium]
MARLRILLTAVMIILPIMVSADNGTDPLRSDFTLSDEGVWQELLNEADAYRLTEPSAAFTNVQPLGYNELEMGVEDGIKAVTCVPPQIPEPTTVILLGLGLLGLGLGGRRRR